MHEREELERQEADLQRALRQALRRPVPLPEGLSERIVKNVLQSHPIPTAEPVEDRSHNTAPARWDWRRAVAAVLLFGAVTGIGSGYLLSRTAREQQAQVQFARAMEITDSTLSNVRERVQRQLEQSTAAVPQESR